MSNKILTDTEIGELSQNDDISSEDDESEIEELDEDYVNEIHESSDSDSTDYESIDIDLSDEDDKNQQNQTAAPVVRDSDDDWHTRVIKPVLLKFRGKEQVNLSNRPPKTPVEFFQRRSAERITIY